MKTVALLFAAVLLALTAFAAPQPAQAAGCVRGAIVGGVLGHLAGHHGMAGAALGCAVGHHKAKQHRREEQYHDSYSR